VAGQRRLEPQIPAGQMTGQGAGRPSRTRDGNAPISSGFVDTRRTARVPSRSGRAPHGASARLDRGPVGAEPSRVDSVLPCTERSFGALFCRRVRHPLRGSLPQTRRAWRSRQLGARIDSGGDCPCAVGVRGGIRLNGYCWRLIVFSTSNTSG
jgi:hypothetical protein